MWRWASAKGLFTDATTELFINLCDHFFYNTLLLFQLPGAISLILLGKKTDAVSFTSCFAENVVSWGGCVSCLYPSHGGLRLPSTSVSTWYSMSASVCSMTAPQPMSLIWQEKHTLKYRSQEICDAQEFLALTHRLELQVLRGMFKMWPKIDRYLKKEKFYCQEWQKEKKESRR